jgi:hypothetical protein
MFLNRLWHPADDAAEAIREARGAKRWDLPVSMASEATRAISMRVLWDGKHEQGEWFGLGETRGGFSFVITYDAR